jgi:hypothetical protein
MDKKLKNHHKYISSRIKELKSKGEASEIRDTLAFHQHMTANFQHERLIHLLVTLFFAALFIATFVLSISLQTSNLMTGDNFYSTFVEISVRTIGLILFVTTLFYLRHYYRLENGCEKLYDLTEDLYKILS